MARGIQVNSWVLTRNVILEDGFEGRPGVYVHAREATLGRVLEVYGSTAVVAFEHSSCECELSDLIALPAA